MKAEWLLRMHRFPKRKEKTDEKIDYIIYHNYCKLSSSMYSTSCDLHWFHYTKPAFDPLCFHGTDAGKKEWIVDRIFLWISGRHVLWVRFWILCINLYVFRIFERIRT